ncbi:DUF11 domain-containing protein [Listeria kieliensis]|uniref:DUF11 domain-containing protein n=1 Tax=Listeria kieliensis TaxID=1621700 RepID=A0A3D8TQD9_9LIST|nr:DUF11 domain-containing protein [Listeria kieliensis]RDX01005.1 hypothetical protein UR08_08585 [Listeria kieliensis]
MKQKKKILSMIVLLLLVLSMGMQIVRASTQVETSQESVTKNSKQQQENHQKDDSLTEKQTHQDLLNKDAQAKLLEQSPRKKDQTKQQSSLQPKLALDDKYEWTESVKNPKGEIEQPDGSQLVFGFDGAGMVDKDTSAIAFGRPNIYVKTTEGEMISLIRGSTANSISGSYSSGLIFIENGKLFDDALQSTSYRKNLKVMTAVDENEHPIIRADMTSTYAKHDWGITTVLKASADGQTIQQEFYLTNLGTELQIGFGKKINTNFSDKPVVSLGNGEGMSVLDGRGHKFNQVVNVKDGPDNWTVNSNNIAFLNSFTPNDWTGTGNETENLSKDEVIAEKINADIKLKWQPRTVGANETTHIRYDIKYVAPEKSIVDKMYDWKEVQQNPKGEVLQPNGNTLVFEFSTTQYEGSMIKNINAFGKPNVYLRTPDGKKIQHLYDATGTLRTSKGLLFLDGTEVINDNLMNNSSSTKDVKVMTAIDENGHTVIRAHMASSATGHDWGIDEVLKPSRDGQSIQHEYYLTNLGEAGKIGLARAVDTQLNNNDRVPIHAIGENRGMYIESDGYRLYYRTNMKDGPENWNGDQFNNDFLSNFTPADWTGAGKEAENLSKGAIIADQIDTGLKLKWLPRDLKLDETAHYRYDVGIVSAGQPVPSLEKNVENISSEDQTEARLGDKLRYTIKLSNTGDDDWNNIEVKDELPDAVSTPENIVLIHANGDAESLLLQDVYNDKTHTLDLTNQTLKSEKEILLTFEGKIINNDKREIINVASGEGQGADGKNYTVSDVARMKVKESSIPHVEKTVKNVNGSDDYLPGDTVEYSLKVGNANKNTAISWDNISLKDVVPEDVTVDPTSFHKTYTKADGTTEESDLAQDTVWQESSRQLLVKQDALKGTEDVVVTFKAKIKNSVANKLVQNTLEVISDEFDPITADASFNVAGQLEFISAPKNISFGKLPIKSFKQTYKPELWDEALQVKDNRSLTISPRWSMLVKLEKPLTGAKSTETLTSLYYKADGQEQMITDEDGAQIYEHTTTDSNAVTISDLWDDDTGLRLDVPAGKAKKDVYSGTLVWTLQDVPGTE